jgi:hypothetical protein
MLIGAQLGGHVHILRWLLETWSQPYLNIDFKAENGCSFRSSTLDVEFTPADIRFLANDVVACAHKPDPKTLDGLELLFSGPLHDFATHGHDKRSDLWPPLVFRAQSVEVASLLVTQGANPFLKLEWWYVRDNGITGKILDVFGHLADPGQWIARAEENAPGAFSLNSAKMELRILCHTRADLLPSF